MDILELLLCAEIGVGVRVPLATQDVAMT
jgi:hypothetical protein